jgi:hypothetical protein
MSWDIFVQDLPADAESVADIPRDYSGKPIGPRAELIEKIRQVVPSADFSDPSWGFIEGETFSIEVNVGEDEITESFAFHVRGGEEAVGVVAAILSHLDLRAIDGQTGEFFEWGEEALQSFRRWKAFRDQVMSDPKR